MTTATEIAQQAALRVKTRHLLDARGNNYLTDPVGFIFNRLKSHVWSKQREILESVRDHRHTAVHSCHSSGKSWLAARAVAWWLSCHKPGEAFAVTTAPTFSQVRAILWREIRRAHAAGNLNGRVNQTEWWLNDELVAYGRKPAEYDQAAFQGIHAKAVLVIIDEAAGVPESLWGAVETITTSDDSRILAIGNPDDPTSKFASVCLPGSGWNVVHVDAYDTPNFTGEEVPEDIQQLLISKTWVEERKAEWGEESPIFISKVRGMFPEESSDGVVPLSFVRRCQHEMDEDLSVIHINHDGADCLWGKPLPTEPVELGVDVGAGGDETVICERRGGNIGRFWAYRTPDSNDAIGRIIRHIQDVSASSVKIDSNGIGWAVAGRLRELYGSVHKARIVPVNVGEASSDPTRFPKLRDEIWWDVGRELSRTQAWDLTRVPESVLGQLIAPKYALDSSGRVKVEQKADTRKRLGRSPDHADALLLAFYNGRNVGLLSKARV